MFSSIVEFWNNCYKETFAKSCWFQKLEGGELSLPHYKGFLLETYHQAALNPAIQAFCLMHMQEHLQHRTEKMFLKHAISEIGHDTLALNDLVALGEDKEAIQSSRPLPETMAYSAYIIYKIQFENPLSYLGYLFHLEKLPTQKGPSYMRSLSDMGVPNEAMGFLEEHAAVDIAHLRLMEEYVSALVVNQKSLDVVLCAIKDTCRLHLLMIEAAFANGENSESFLKETSLTKVAV